MALLEATKGGGIFFGLFDWRSKFAEAERRPSFTDVPGITCGEAVVVGLISLVEFIKAILFGVGADFADPEAADDPEVADLKPADPADKVEAADRVEAAEAAEAAEAPRATGVGGEIDVDEGEDTPPPLIKVVLVL